LTAESLDHGVLWVTTGTTALAASNVNEDFHSNWVFPADYNGREPFDAADFRPQIVTQEPTL
jgi:hypothetical protein